MHALSCARPSQRGRGKREKGSDPVTFFFFITFRRGKKRGKRTDIALDRFSFGEGRGRVARASPFPKKKRTLSLKKKGEDRWKQSSPLLY